MKPILALGLLILGVAGCAAPRGAGEATNPTGAESAHPTTGNDETKPEPVTGAFGITLGERFQRCSVDEVLSEEPKSYRVADAGEHEGLSYAVRPSTANAHFDRYQVLTNEHGVVYAIEAFFEDPEGASQCNVSAKVADLLEQKYGPPRGKGRLGDWYAFRDMTVDHYRGIRLISNRCRRGIYSIHYTDDGAKLLVPENPVLPATPTDSSGL